MGPVKNATYPYLVLLSTAFLGFHPVAGAQGLGWQHQNDTVALLKDGRPVWQFNYSLKHATKPFFHPVALPGGPPLTWRSPEDHPWHLALWFSWKLLNGVNYWEEDKSGIPDGPTRWATPRLETRGDFSAVISMDLHCRAPGSAGDILTEKRLIRISPPGSDGSYMMDWQMEFGAGQVDVVMDRTPPETKPDGNARGGYAGLSIRFARELTNGRVAATAAIGALQNKRYGFAATAADFNGEIGGKEAGVAILDHPANPRAPTRWYTITDASVPFWYLNAAWLQPGPYKLPAGQKMTLRYRVAVHPQRWDPIRLQTEFDRYIREAGR
jgi:hypothetical protein